MRIGGSACAACGAAARRAILGSGAVPGFAIMRGKNLRAGVGCRLPCEVYVKVLFAVAKHPVIVAWVSIPIRVGARGWNSHVESHAATSLCWGLSGAPGRLRSNAAQGAPGRGAAASASVESRTAAVCERAWLARPPRRVAAKISLVFSWCWWQAAGAWREWVNRCFGRAECRGRART